MDVGSGFLSRLFVHNPLDDLAHPPRGNVPALDALRSFAVILVIESHFSGAFVKASGASTWFGRLPIVSGGRFGVDLFFVLSGYLIGGQLWRELGKRGTVNIGRFMLRRCMRIWPLYFFFFVFVILFLSPGRTAYRGWTDVVFLTNYYNQGVVMGSWSLCTEEQFYIVAPLLILIGSSLCRPTPHYGKILVGLLLLLPVARALTWWRITGDFHHRDTHAFAKYLYTPFHTHADGLIIGLLIAYYRSQYPRRATEGFLASGLAVLLATALFGMGHVLQREVFDFLGIALMFGAMVQYCLSHRPKWLAFVEFPGFYLISRLSYGMYLNHEYIQGGIAQFTLRWLPFPGPGGASREIVGAGLLIAISMGLSLVTYCLVEHPFLQLRDVVQSRHPEPGHGSMRLDPAGVVVDGLPAAPVLLGMSGDIAEATGEDGGVVANAGAERSRDHGHSGRTIQAALPE